MVIRGTPSAALAGNAASGQAVVTVADSSIFTVGQEVNVYDTNTASG